MLHCVKKYMFLLVWMIELFSTKSHAYSISRRSKLDRKQFMKKAFIIFSATTSSCTNYSVIKDASALEFIPASPSFKYTYKDGIDIVSTQRVACDNIIDVISDGNWNEASFKIMQLNAQTKVGGKILLDTLQATNSFGGNKDGKIKKSVDAINTLKLLTCKEKFATLIELSSDCEVQISKALNGKIGQVRLLSSMKSLRNAFDEFLLAFVEDTTNTSL